MSQPEQPDLRALPARDSATPSNDHQPQDLANVVSNAESVDLQISMDFYSVVCLISAAFYASAYPH